MHPIQSATDIGLGISLYTNICMLNNSNDKSITNNNSIHLSRKEITSLSYHIITSKEKKFSKLHTSDTNWFAHLPKSLQKSYGGMDKKSIQCF